MMTPCICIITLCICHTALFRGVYIIQRCNITVLHSLLYSQNKMFYTDYVSNRIYSADLDTGDNVELLLNDSVEVPGMCSSMY